MEADSSQKEEAEFENVAAARSDQKDKEGHYSAALENSKQAISKTIEVKKGDRIKASVFATHNPAIAETDPTNDNLHKYLSYRRNLSSILFRNSKMYIFPSNSQCKLN